MKATVTNLEEKRKAVSLADVFAKLAQHALAEPALNGQVRDICLSPEHADSNPSCDYDVKKNCWHCKVCDTGGGYRELVLHAMPELKTKPAASIWLKTHGLALNVQQQWENADVLYGYVDEDGKLLLQVGRWNGPPKEFRQRMPDGNGGWLFTLKELKRRVPFKLPNLLQAIKRGETIYVCEGEKDCLTLFKQGVMATTNPQGAKWKWPLEWTDYFTGAKRVVVIADNDKAGREAAAQRAGIIARRCADVRLIESLPGVAEKGDISDWLAIEGNNSDALVRVVEEHSVKVKAYEPEYSREAVEALIGDMTDSGNGAWVAAVRGHKLRWRPQLNRWARYRRGKWTTQEVNVEHEAEKAVDIMRTAASEYDGPNADAFRDHAEKSRSGRGRHDMMTSAAGKLGLFERFFDANRLLFNCKNGTLDLSNVGDIQLRPHQYDDFITFQSPVAYDPNATCPKFEAWLLERVDNSQALFNYMQEVMGSCLEGRSGLRRFYFILGPKGTGKSTFVRTLNKLLGDYQCTADFKTLSENRYGGGGSGASPDLLRLRGRRLVSASEAKDSQILDNARIKQLIGGDKIAVRGLYQADLIEFPFDATLIMSGNELPKIIGDDSIWDKLKPVPFVHQIEDEDPDYEQSVLDRELSGILNFVIQGLARLRADNYHVPDPPEVKAAREEEMTEQDPFADWAAENLEFGPRFETDAMIIYERYTAWCKRTHQYASKRNRLTRWLSTKRDVKQRHSGDKRYYVGVQPRYAEADAHYPGDKTPF